MLFLIKIETKEEQANIDVRVDSSIRFFFCRGTTWLFNRKQFIVLSRVLVFDFKFRFPHRDLVHEAVAVYSNEIWHLQPVVER